MAALKSIQGSTIFTTATKSKKMMSDLNFNLIPSEIKYFIPGKETFNDIPNLFGSLQKMKIICFVVVMLSLSMFICLMTCLLPSLTHVDLSSTVIMLLIPDKSIHVTSDNNIIVGVIEPGNTFTPTDKSTRALLIFGMDGKQQHTYQYDSNKHRLSTTTMSLLLFVVILHGKVNSLCLLLSY
jgi:hypothetical protein